MDIRKIEAFSKVYEQKSFSKAGRELYLSQPTISAHVASLEQELGVVLFDRIGRLVVPTKAGDVLYAHARRIFEATGLALSEIHDLQNRVTGVLDIGGSTIPANYILPVYLSRFLKQYPEVSVDLRVADSEEIITKVRNHALMVGVVGTVLDAQDVHFESLLRDKLVFVLPRILYKKYSSLETVQMLRSVSWVMREDGSGTRAAMLRSIENFSLNLGELNIAITVRNASAMSRCVSSGIGAAITSYISVKEYIQAGDVVVVERDDLCLERMFYLVYSKKRTLFPAALRLVDFLKTTMRSAIDME